MAIKTNTGFQIGSEVSIDSRITLTSDEMLNINDNTQPAKYFAINQDDGQLYLYDKEAEPNETTGKFSKIEGGNGNIWQGTQAEYEAEKDEIPNGTLIVITDDDEAIVNVFKDVTQEEYDALPDTKLTDGTAYIISEEGETTAKFVRNGKEISGGESYLSRAIELNPDNNFDEKSNFIYGSDNIAGGGEEVTTKTGSISLTQGYSFSLPDIENTEESKNNVRDVVIEHFEEVATKNALSEPKVFSSSNGWYFDLSDMTYNQGSRSPSYFSVVFHLFEEKSTTNTTLLGQGLKTSTDNAVVFGSYNKNQSAPFVIGNGTDALNTSDLMYANEDGDLHISGNYYINDALFQVDYSEIDETKSSYIQNKPNVVRGLVSGNSSSPLTAEHDKDNRLIIIPLSHNINEYSKILFTQLIKKEDSVSHGTTDLISSPVGTEVLKAWYPGIGEMIMKIQSKSDNEITLIYDTNYGGGDILTYFSIQDYLNYIALSIEETEDKVYGYNPEDDEWQEAGGTEVIPNIEFDYTDKEGNVLPLSGVKVMLSRISDSSDDYFDTKTEEGYKFYVGDNYFARYSSLNNVCLVIVGNDVVVKAKGTTIGVSNQATFESYLADNYGTPSTVDGLRPLEVDTLQIDGAAYRIVGQRYTAGDGISISVDNQISLTNPIDIVTEWEETLSDEKVPSERLVKTSINGLTIQVEELPASKNNLGKIYQYIGETNDSYIKGRFYESREEATITTSFQSWVGQDAATAPYSTIYTMEGTAQTKNNLYYFSNGEMHDLDPAEIESFTNYVGWNLAVKYYGNDTSYTYTKGTSSSAKYTPKGWYEVLLSDPVQVTELPDVTEKNKDKVYEYVGTTTADYTKGHFYEVAEGEPTTYCKFVNDTATDINRRVLYSDTDKAGVNASTLYRLDSNNNKIYMASEITNTSFSSGDFYIIYNDGDFLDYTVTESTKPNYTWTEVEFGGGSDGVFTPDANATTVAVGGVPKGYDFTDKEYTINEVLNMIFFPYVKFIFSALAGGGSYEYGKSVTVSKVTPTFEAGSKAITLVTVGTTDGGKDLYDGTSYTSGAITLTTSKTFDGTTGGKVYCTLSDGKTTLKQSTTVSYVKSIYYATGASATEAPTTGTKGNNVDITVAKDNYIYFLCPDKTKTQIQQYAVGQWNDVDTTYVGEVAFTNSEGAALTYQAYRTNQLAAMTGKFQIK